MSYRARGSTETYPTARQAAERALGTATVMLVGFDLFMDMHGKTCIVERI